MIVRNIGNEAIKKLNNPLMRFNATHINKRIKNGNYFTKRYISFTRVQLSHYLEDYYTNPEIATNMVSPMSEYVWWGWIILQPLIVFGTLFHSNYYFTGKALPKVQGNSQLCEDSW